APSGPSAREDAPGAEHEAVQVRPSRAPDERVAEGRRPRRRREERDDEDEAARPSVKVGTSGKATASMVCGLSSVLCLLNILTGLPAIILGMLALKDINN